MMNKLLFNYQNQMQQLESQQGMGIGNLVQKEIKASEGGTLETPQGARLEIPPGAIERGCECDVLVHL